MLQPLRSMSPWCVTTWSQAPGEATGGVRPIHGRTWVVRRVIAVLPWRRAPDQASSLVGRLARLGWTRIGSPGIFG